MTKRSLCRLADGTTIYYDDQGSHAATHFADTPQLLPLVKEFLSTRSFSEDKVYAEHDTGKVIGSTDLVEITAKDEIVYAKRKNRDTYTKFVKNRVSPPTSYFAVVLKKEDDGSYELASAWVGRLCPSFPDEPDATPESKPFWENHALVFGTQAIQAGTLTKESPWR